MADREVTDGPSPIVIGGGSVTIDFDDAVYVKSSNSDDWNSEHSEIKILKIKDAGGNIIDLSPLLPGGNPKLCRIKIFCDGNSKESIRIKGSPLGIHFSGKDIKKGGNAGKPKSWYNSDFQITSVEISNVGSIGTITFDEPPAGSCAVLVDRATRSSRSKKRKAASKKVKSRKAKR